MLNMLHIENVAVIEKTEVEFGPGLNVLTGETGAGKSIVIDAIGALLGDRVSKGLVRTGAENALITAELTLDKRIEAWLEGNDFEAPEDNSLLLMRKISADGKSSCRVNGVPISVAQLRELGMLLIDIHGQNDGQKLLAEANHRAYLDAFAGLEKSLEEYRKIYKKYRDTEKKLKELKKSETDKELRIEELKRRIKEISDAGPKQGEQEELLERRNILKNAGKLTGYIERAYFALYGDEDQEGALSLITEAESSALAAAKVTESIRELAGSIGELRYQTEDITEQLGRLKDSLDFSPNELETIEARLALLQRLERRYGSVEDCLKYLHNAENELEDMESLSDRLVCLESEANKAKLEVKKFAGELSSKRKEAAKILQTRIASELNELSMPGARFEVEFLEKADPDDTGCDDIRFLMSANAGEALGRISKIASGGELSRIMLAMKNVLASSDEVGILIFDEIDTGVSGIAAQRVGEKLSELAYSKQVLCVTHLPQIAVMADRHFSIEKQQKDSRTYTIVSPLDTQGRKEELARLIGGDNITQVTLLGAGELLDAANKFKERNKK